MKKHSLQLYPDFRKLQKEAVRSLACQKVYMSMARPRKSVNNIIFHLFHQLSSRNSKITIDKEERMKPPRRKGNEKEKAAGQNPTDNKKNGSWPLCFWAVMSISIRTRDRLLNRQLCLLPHFNLLQEYHVSKRSSSRALSSPFLSYRQAHAGSRVQHERPSRH